MSIPPNKPPGKPSATPPVEEHQASGGKRSKKKKKGGAKDRLSSKANDLSASVHSSPSEIRYRAVSSSEAASLMRAGRKKVRETKVAAKLDNMEVIRNEEANQVIDAFSERAQALKLDKGQRSPEANYVLGHCHLSRGEYQRARHFCDDLLKQNLIDQTMRGRALLLRGKINLFEHCTLTDDDAKDFHEAYQCGNPEAGRFYMLAKMGYYSGVCTLAWIDPFQVVQVASELVNQRKEYIKALAREQVRAEAAGNEEKTLLCDVVSSLESAAIPKEYTDFSTLFPLLLCEMFERPDEKQAEIARKIDVALRVAEKRGVNTINYLAIYYYGRMRRSGVTREAIEQLLGLQADVSRALVGEILIRTSEDGQALSTLKKVQSLPLAYDLRIEILMKQKRFKAALGVCVEACKKIEGYFRGKQEFFGYKFGEQANWVEQSDHFVAEKIRLSEIHAATHLWERFQNKIDLLQEFVDVEAIATKPARTDDRPGKKEVTGGGSKEPDDKSIHHKEESGRADAEVEIVAAALESTPLGESVGAESEKARKKIQAVNVSVDHAMQAVINKANVLIDRQSELDMAEAMLLDLKPEKGSLMWFRQQQSLCWVYKEKGISYDYLFNKVLPGQRTSDLALGYLEKSASLARQLIKDLVIQAEKDAPELARKEAADRLYKNQKKYMSVAQVLEQQTPGFRRMYGGLYSVLAHVQKAFVENPSSEEKGDKAVRKGLDFYQIANRIRGYG